MDYEFRVVVEKVSVQSQKVVKRETLDIYDIEKPESILDLGQRCAIFMLSDLAVVTSSRINPG